MTAAIAAAAAMIVFWAGFGFGRASTTARGRRHAGHTQENGPRPDTRARPGPAQGRTGPYRAADPPTVVSSDTLDRWADQWHAAPVVEDVQLPPLPDVTAAAQLPRPRNVVWQPTAAAAAATALPVHATGAAIRVAGWYWDTYVRTEHELWGPAGIDGPWAPGSIAATAHVLHAEMAPVIAAAAPALAAIAAAGMAGA